DVAEVVEGTYATRDLRENGIWRDDWVANPSLAPVVDVGFLLVVPAGPKPAGGWPVAFGAHGIGGRNTISLNDSTHNSFCSEVGELFARNGIACLGIDAPNHGSRGNLYDFFAVDDLARARDNFRQMVFDQMQLARAAAALDV